LIEHRHINYAVAFSPDGKFVLTGSWDSTIRLSDVQTGEEVRQFTGHNSGVNSVAFSPDGKYVAAATHRAGAWLWEAATGQVVRQFSDANLYRVAFSPDGKYIVTAGSDGIASFWDIQQGDSSLIHRHHLTYEQLQHFPRMANTYSAAIMTTSHGCGMFKQEEEVRRFISHTDIYICNIFTRWQVCCHRKRRRYSRLWDTPTEKNFAVLSVTPTWKM
jgi:WD40 repeat protein